MLVGEDSLFLLALAISSLLYPVSSKTFLGVGDGEALSFASFSFFFGWWSGGSRFPCSFLLPEGQRRRGRLPERLKRLLRVAPLATQLQQLRRRALCTILRGPRELVKSILTLESMTYLQEQGGFAAHTPDTLLLDMGKYASTPLMAEAQALKQALLFARAGHGSAFFCISL